jgi:hypothetical protein
MATERDIVFISRNNKPVTYAMIEKIEPAEKKDMIKVTFVGLSLPPSRYTQILRPALLDGESFTIGGEPMVITPLNQMITPEAPARSIISKGQKEPDPPAEKQLGKVIQFKRPKEEITLDEPDE